MKEHKRDKDKRDIALQTPGKGKKANSSTPPPRSGSDPAQTGKKSKKQHNIDDEFNDDVQKGHGGGNFDEGDEGPQGYGKAK
jgi:hypothetical protein